MIELCIDKAVKDQFPELMARGFEADGLASAPRRPVVPSLDEIVDGLEALGAVDMESLALSTHVAGWRNAIAACGLKPSRYRSSVEALARRNLKGDVITTPVPWVDLYCAVSAKHLATLGAYDIDRLPSTTLMIRRARSEDAFEPLGGRADDMPLTEKVIVYAAEDEVLCYAFNHRDSAATSLLGTTERAFFVGEAVTDSQAEALSSALAELRQRLTDAGVRVGEIHTYS